MASLDIPLNIKPSSRPIYVLTALSCIGGFLFGYDTGVISGALVLITNDFPLSEIQKELIVGMTVAGALVSSIVAGRLSDIYGRVPVILASSICFVAGSLMLCFAESYVTLILGRLVVGFGVGTASMSMPVYVGEAAPTSIRGFLVTCINVAITGGQFFSSCIDGLFSEYPNGWRYMLGFAAVPAVFQFIGFLYLPESPRWLLEHGKTGDATVALRKLRDCDDVRAEVEAILEVIRNEKEAEQKDIHINNSIHDISLPRVMSQTSNISGEEKPRSDINIWAKLTETKTSRALLLGSMLQAAQQFCGINTVMYYSATILKLAGFTSNSQAIWLSAGVSFCNFFGSIVSLYYVDSSGRRRLTLLSIISVSICLALIACSFWLAEVNTPKNDVPSGLYSSFGTPDKCSSQSYCFDCVQVEGCGFCAKIPKDFDASSQTWSYFSGCIRSDEDSPYNTTQCFDSSDSSNFSTSTCTGGNIFGWMIFMSICIYLLCFSPGMGPMPWCINSEIYATSIRGVGNSVSTSVNWGSNLIMSLSFLSVTTALSKQGAFAMYSLIGFLFTFYFYFYLPETRGLSLEDITALFADGQWGKAHLNAESGPIIQRGCCNMADNCDEKELDEEEVKKKKNGSISTDTDRKSSKQSGDKSGQFSFMINERTGSTHVYSAINQDTNDS